jgi:LuxR family transcriptional regulator, maltose regulon positive regulatory protein
MTTTGSTHSGRAGSVSAARSVDIDPTVPGRHRHDGPPPVKVHISSRHSRPVPVEDTPARKGRATGRQFPAAGGLLRRERLHHLLDSALDGTWAVLCAPAGCGKSSLLAGWVAELPARVEVTTILEGDLLARLTEHFGRPAPASGRRVLVVDHGDGLSRAAWRRLAALVEGDRSTTVVVATRVDPLLPLGRLAIAGELVEIRARDLRWTDPEMRALLRHAGLDLDENAVDLLRTRTAGWSAGLRLAIAGIRRAQDPYEFLLRFGEDDHATIDYLAQEVFAALPQRLRDLLAATAGSADLTAASATAVSGLADAGRLLDDLVDEGLLCTADDEDAVRRYRYHPLLLSLLRRDVRAPGRIARQRSAHWHAAHARPAPAVVDASFSGDHELTVQLLQEHGADLLGDAPRRRAVSQGLSSLPPDWRQTYAHLLPLAGLLQVLEGQDERATQLLTDAEHRQDGSWPVAARYDLLALRAWAAARGWRDPERCLAEMSELGHLRRDPPVLVEETDVARESLLLGRLGILLAWHGDPAIAGRLLEAAARSGRAAYRGTGRVGALTREAWAGHALLLVAAGRPATAATVAQEVLAAGDDSALADTTTGTARLAAAWSAYLRGLPGEARTQLARADAGLDGAGLPVRALLAAVLRARLVLPVEGPAAARAALRAGGGHTTAPPWVRALATMTELRIAAMTGEFDLALAAVSRELAPGGAEMRMLAAELALGAGDPAVAREQLRPVLTWEAPAVAPWGLVRASHLDAAAAHVLGDATAAAQGVVRTLVLGAGEEIVLPLGELPDGVPGLTELLEAYPRAVGLAGAPAYLAVLRDRLPGLTVLPPVFTATPAAASPRPPAVLRPPADVDPAVLAGARTLTGRELDVLARLDSVLPLSTIADGMYVTLNTLKTHVGAIYRKLGADNRADAVTRAQELGLIDPR